jgi:hypothetical protein
MTTKRRTDTSFDPMSAMARSAVFARMRRELAAGFV